MSLECTQGAVSFCRQPFELRACGRIVFQHLNLRPAVAPVIRRQFVTAEGAQPCEQRRFAPPGPNLADGGDNRGLGDFLCYVPLANAGQRESIEPGVIRVEERRKGGLIAVAHVPDKLPVVHSEG